MEVGHERCHLVQVRKDIKTMRMHEYDALLMNSSQQEAEVFKKALKEIIVLDADMRSNIINHSTTKEKVGVHYFWRAVGIAKDALKEARKCRRRRT